MAGPYYVDSSATAGAETGADWTNAYLSIEDVDSVVGAGEIVYVASDHQEEKASGSSFVVAFTSGTDAAPIIIICTDDQVNTPPQTYENMATGGGYIRTVGTNDDITLSGHIVAYGLNLISADRMSFGAGGNVMWFYDCTIDTTDQVSFIGGEASYRFVGGTFDLNATLFVANSDSSMEFRGTTLVCTRALGMAAIQASVRLSFEDCDLSGVTSYLVDYSYDRCQVTVNRCVLHTDHLGTPKLADDTPGHIEEWVQVESCLAGTDTDPVPGLNYFAGFYGTIEHDESEYRTGGANNGTYGYSWKMTCNANTVSRHAALKTPLPMVAWVTPSDTTIKVYVAHDAVGDGTAGDLQDDECWLEVEFPDEASPATAQAEYVTTLPTNVLTAAVDLTNEGADQWQGTPTTYQEMSVTISPEEEGPCIVRVCLATGASSIVWVDPKVHVS